MTSARIPLGRERIVDGTTSARQRFADLFETAASGTPVLIVSGDRQVLMVERSMVLDLIERIEAAEETLALMSDPEALRKIVRSEDDARSGQGISPDDAARLLGLEEE